MHGARDTTKTVSVILYCIALISSTELLVSQAFAATSLAAISFTFTFSFPGCGAYKVPSLASVDKPFCQVGVHPSAGLSPAPSNACSKS
jgi:hypothetical protein